MGVSDQFWDHLIRGQYGEAEQLYLQGDEDQRQAIEGLVTINIVDSSDNLGQAVLTMGIVLDYCRVASFAAREPIRACLHDIVPLSTLADFANAGWPMDGELEYNAVSNQAGSVSDIEEYIIKQKEEYYINIIILN